MPFPRGDDSIVGWTGSAAYMGGFFMSPDLHERGILFRLAYIKGVYFAAGPTFLNFLKLMLNCHSNLVYFHYFS